MNSAAKRRLRRAACCLLLLGPMTLWSQTEGRVMLDWVRGIEGRSPDGRRVYITSQLDSIGVPYTLMPFDTTITRQGWTRQVEGKNIIVRMGSSPPAMIVGAHYDAVETSPGANDNGGGVAVLLMLIAKLRTHGWNQTVDFAFFDQEEVGLIGSAVYVRQAVDRIRHRAMINLDVVGTGEVIYVGPVGGGDDDRVMRFLRQAAGKADLPLDERERYPGSDHLSFARAGLENISLSVMPLGVVDRLDAMMSGSAVEQAEMPEVLAVMHTPNDSSGRMSGQALALVFALVREAVLDLDATDR